MTNMENSVNIVNYSLNLKQIRIPKLQGSPNNQQQVTCLYAASMLLVGQLCPTADQSVNKTASLQP